MVAIHPDQKRLDDSDRAERAVLGSMLRENAVIGDVLQIVRGESFRVDAHQRIFQAITALYDKAKPVDLVTLAERLKADNSIADAGGYGFLGDLWDASPTAANAEHYAKIVRDNCVLRELGRAGGEIAADAQNPTADADGLLESAEKRIMGIADMGVMGATITLAESMTIAVRRMDARSEQDPFTASGIPTGLTDLDSLTSGFQDSELAIIAARPSVGKTALALNIAHHVAVRERLPVFFASLEQASVEIGERMLSLHSGVDAFKMRQGRIDADDTDRMMQAMSDMGKAQLFIDDSPGQSMLRIAANARRLKLRRKIRLVVVDYLQLIETDRRSVRDNRQEQVADISRRLKFLARELKIPVVALAQLNRQSEAQNRRPRLSDLRESGQIEQDADTVIMLHREEQADPMPGGTRVVEPILALVEKQRNGPTGEVVLQFDKRCVRFTSAAFEDGRAPKRTYSGRN